MYAIQPPAITGVKECAPCTVVVAQLRLARQDGNAAREMDARVQLRRHLREAHGKTMALFLQ